MNINELMKSLSVLNSEFTRLIKKTGIEKYEDLSGTEADSDSPEQLLLVEELRKVMLNISKASDTISFLQKPIKPKLHRKHKRKQRTTIKSD